MCARRKLRHWQRNNMIRGIADSFLPGQPSCSNNAVKIVPMRRVEQKVTELLLDCRNIFFESSENLVFEIFKPR